MSNAPPAMAIRHDRLDHVPVVRLRGDIDLATSPAVAAALADRLDRRPALLVLDFTHVGFVGACGLKLLTDARRRARAHGGTVAVACCCPQVLRAMEVTNLLGVIAPYPTVADALVATDIPSQRVP
ncbi:STAS domain-containing protein [Actinokineospora inagensis]|uniref:STAS domain-containing protein n=1 Tax=Actinokineospora inagensis TaxID=103730 RepID=UPI0003F4DEE9|nr:STAS domain-containing protein [Actinokineospora inagensis]